MAEGGFDYSPALLLFFLPVCFFIVRGGSPHLLDRLEDIGSWIIFIREADQVFRLHIGV